MARIEPGVDRWRLEFTPYLWTAGINGEFDAGETGVNIDRSFSDILENSDSLIGLAGRVEIGKGAFSGFVDGLYMRLAIDDASGPLGFSEVDAEVELGMADFGLMYRVGDWALGDSSRRGRASIDVYAGGRYTVLSLELDPALRPSREEDRDWLDPIVGVRGTLPLGRLHLSAWGDVGGFGLSSEITWSANAVIGYDFTLFGRPASVFAGYRAVGWDYSDGDGEDSLAWDVVLHGPILGLSLQF